MALPKTESAGSSADLKIRIGVSGWSIPSRYSAKLPLGGSHLTRYSRAFPVVEITTAFYRSHQFKTYARWQDSVGPDFRFSVKTPKTLTHEGALRYRMSADLERFLEEVAGLGSKLYAILVQLPPSLALDLSDSRRFFMMLRRHLPGSALVCEPRHESWNSDKVEALFKDLGVARAAVDPSRYPQDRTPGGDRSLSYFRMHGAPRTYYSDYPPERLRQLLGQLRLAARQSEQVWCLFDNTAHGHAIGNALALQQQLHAAQSR